MRNSEKKKVAFTLVELLVVIAIISILAAILLPAIRNARQKADLTICISNQKQVYMAFCMHADENTGRLVNTPECNSYSNGFDPGHWLTKHDRKTPYRLIHILYKTPSAKRTNYIDSVESFVCPEYWADPDVYTLARNGHPAWKNHMVYGGQAVNFYFTVGSNGVRAGGYKGIHAKPLSFNHPSHSWMRMCCFHNEMVNRPRKGIGTPPNWKKGTQTNAENPVYSANVI